jgi:hypothetical protein
MPDTGTDPIAQLRTAIAGDAPRLADALGGPDAAIVVSALGRTLVGDALASAEQVLAAMHTADKAAIQAAEQDTLNRLRKLGESLAPSDAAAPNGQAPIADLLRDTENARQMLVKSHDSTTKYLAYGISAAFAVVLIALIAGAFFNAPIGADIKPLLYTLLGVLATAWANIIGFYFGSSAGSMQKSQAISASLIQQSSGSAPAGE